MTKEEFLQIVKKHFLKFGFSEKVLSEIAALVKSSFNEDDELTNEAVAEKLKAYEPIAKSFQSEIDQRVSKAKEKTMSEDAADEEEEEQPKHSASDKRLTQRELIEKLFEKIETLEKGQSVKTNNEKAVQRLKELKMSDREIEAAMFGRNFETEKSMTEFVEKQEELYKEILKDRAQEQAGNGFLPQSSNGNVSKESIQSAIDHFNKNF